MLGMLEISGSHYHRVYILAVVEFFVVSRCGHRLSGDLLHMRGTFLAALLPNVRERDEFEIQFSGVSLKRGKQRFPETVREPDNAHSHAIVCAKHA